MKEILLLFFTFLRIGTFTFGGGYAMIPALRRDAVDRYHWLNEEEFVDITAISQSLPGAFVTNFALFLGKKRRGWPGAFAASFGVILPAFVVIIVILLFLDKIENNLYVNSAFEGIMAASAALILATVWGMGRKVLENKLGYGIAGISFILIVVLKISAVWALILGGIIGYVSYRLGRSCKNADERGDRP